MTMLDEPTTTDDAPAGPEPDEGRDQAGTDTVLATWRSQLPVLLVLALALAVAVGAAVLWSQNQGLAGAEDDRQDAARVAGDFTTAVLSYDHRDLRGSVDDVVALATPDWGREYEDLWFREQQPVVEELRAVAEVDVRDVLLGEEQDGVVPAVVVFNASIRSQIGTRRLGGSYLRLDLTTVDGEWRVDDMSFLASTEQSLDPAAAAGDPGTGGGG